MPTLILTIVTETPLVGLEKAAVRTYWAALWKAGDDQTAITAASNALVAALGAARADTIRTDYLPRNLADLPPAGADRAGTTVIVAFLEFPDDATLPVRQSTWSQVAEARALPDRLVLIGRVGGAETLNMLGNPIPSPLAVTPDPSADPDDQTKPLLDNGGIQFDEGMRWMVDFERAVKIGMGFRVPLDPVRLPPRLRRIDGARRTSSRRCRRRQGGAGGAFQRSPARRAPASRSCRRANRPTISKARVRGL